MKDSFFKINHLKKLFVWLLMPITRCLFNWFGQVHGISTIVGYSMPNPVSVEHILSENKF